MGGPDVRLIRILRDVRMLHVDPIVHAPITENRPGDQEREHELPLRHDSNRRRELFLFTTRLRGQDRFDPSDTIHEVAS
jgi:hypothetical protein